MKKAPAASSTSKKAPIVPRLTKREIERLEEAKRKALQAQNEGHSADVVTPDAYAKDHVNEEFLRHLREDADLEKLAKSSGVLRDGKLLSLKSASNSTGSLPVRKIHPATGNAATTTQVQASPVSGARLTSAGVKRKADNSVAGDQEDSNGLLTPDGKQKKKKLMRQPASATAADKANKGLRHFSMKVCQKVEEKQTTTYNEVADELVKELTENQSLQAESGYDEKNIRRRVYDALNVLMAMDIISKEKKEIKWKGLPSNARHDVEVLHRERQTRLKNIEKKKQHLRELLVQHIAFQSLISRNNARLQTEDDEDEETRIHLPFIIINTDSQTVIQCEMSEDRQDIFFNFSAPFEINDDNEILKRMGLHKVSKETVKELLPEELIPFVPSEVYE